MPRVILDAVRRFRWIWVILLAVLTTGWVFALRPGVPPALVWLAFAFSFFVAQFACLQLRAGPASPLRLRLVHTLPVRRADLGSGVWWLAVLGSALVTASAKVLAAAIVRAASIATPADLSWVMFSGVFDFAYVGSMWWLQLQAVRVAIAIGRGRSLLYSMLGMMGFLYVGGALALAQYIPTSWTGWRWHTGVVLAVLLGMTVASRRHATRHAVLGARSLIGLRSAAPARSADVATAPPLVPFDSRLSVLRRMLWQQFRSAILVSIIVIVLLVVMGAAPYPRTQGFWVHLRQEVSILPTELGAETWVLGWILYFTIGISRWQPSKLPLLRILPISVREMSLILFLRTVVTSGAFWLAVLPIYILSPAATHPWMGLGWLAALIGISGLTSAATVRWQGSPLPNFVILGVNYLMVFGRQWTHMNSSLANTAAGELAAFALGTCAIAATFIWNRRLLMHPGRRSGRATWMWSKS